MTKMNMACNTDAPTTPKTRKRGRSRRRRRSVNSAQRRRRRDSNDDDSDDDSSSNDNDSQDNGRHHHRRIIEPFAVTFLKVGLTLFLCSVLSYATFLRAFYMQQPRLEDRASLREERIVLLPKQQHQQQLHENKGLKANFASKLLRRPTKKKEETASLTDFDATVAANDAYGIASKYYDMDQHMVPQNQTVDTASNNNTQKPQDDHLDDAMVHFKELAARRRSQFASLVGGEKQARATLQRSLSSFLPQTNPKGKDNFHFPSLALRLRDLQLQQQQDDERPVFSVVVLGSSAAAGSGNYYEQSYAFVLENLMAPLFQALNIDLRVQNLALEHTSEFPSLWCSRHYLLQQSHKKLPDLVVWDYGLTSRPEGFESFLRNIAWVDSDGRTPFLIVRDTKIPNNNEHRDELLQSYVDHNVFVDPLLVHIDQAVAPYLTHPDENDESIPEGFRAWTASFGGPPGAPGKEHTHLTVKQHLITGWLISMHMLSALELAAIAIQKGLTGENFILPESDFRTSKTIHPSLPPPIVIKQKKKESWTYGKDEELIDESPPAWLPLLVGEPEEMLEKVRTGDNSVGAGQGKYTPPKELQCHTSYITPHASDSLDELIISGPVEGLWDEDSSSKNRLEQIEGLLLPKGKQFFNEGWVQDLDIATKRRKQLSKRWNFLGFQDMIKKAYYGLQSSGDLTLFVPLSDTKSRQAKLALRETGIMAARDYIETVLICEADVPRSILPSDSDREEDGACRLHKDTYVHVGETMAFMEVIPSGVSSSCVFINVPDSANLAFKQELVKKATLGRPDRGSSQGIYDSALGLPIRIRVRSDRGDMKVPCSVAHVLWNEAREEDSTN